VNYNVIATPRFRNELKRLAKKFPSLKTEYDSLIDSLSIQPIQGTPIGKDCYKIRLAIASKGKGKSGGARVITNIYVAEETVYLLSIYDKSERSTISSEEIFQLLKEIR
jgi:mRNA-degrading endonuclease RelE of RelBE toxin-antitoxin system